jgi:hypothetical protein
MFAYLIKNFDKIPLVSNSIVFLDGNEVLEIIKNDKKIGLKNISLETWFAQTTGETKEVEPNKIKDFSDCISLLIFGNEYKIENIEERGDNNNG